MPKEMGDGRDGEMVHDVGIPKFKIYEHQIEKMRNQLL